MAPLAYEFAAGGSGFGKHGGDSLFMLITGRLQRRRNAAIADAHRRHGILDSAQPAVARQQQHIADTHQAGMPLDGICQITAADSVENADAQLGNDIAENRHKPDTAGNQTGNDQRFVTDQRLQPDRTAVVQVVQERITVAGAFLAIADCRLILLSVSFRNDIL